MLCRDRTQEFQSTATLIAKRRAASNRAATPPLAKPLKPRSEFLLIAKSIQNDIHNTYSKLEKLTLLAKKKSLFDDRPKEIQELTYIINKDITGLTQQITRLQQFQEAKGRSGDTQQNNSHSISVVASLKDRVGAMSISFKDVLETRTENLKSQQQRKDQFATPSSSNSRETSRLRNRSGDDASMYSYADNAYANNGGDNIIDMGTASDTMQLIAPGKNTYIESRAQAVEDISKTLNQLTGVFQQLGEILNSQMPDLERIDQNLSVTEENVSLAHNELLKYFHSVSSNRWLMMKIFGILILFFVFFVVFLA